MGFCYARNPYTNRETLVCDVCSGYKGDNNRTEWVRKRSCPYSYCQAYALCNVCWKKHSAKEWKESHKKCKTYADDYETLQREKQEILNAGKWLRVSAVEKDGKVEVIFRNKEGQEKTILVRIGFYGSVPIMANKTIEDFEEGRL